MLSFTSKQSLTESGIPFGTHSYVKKTRARKKNKLEVTTQSPFFPSILPFARNGNKQRMYIAFTV